MNSLSLNNNIFFTYRKLKHLFLFILINILYFLQLTINFYDNDSRYKFNSNMLAESDLSFGFYRMLAVDNNVILPYNCFIRFLITSLDVLHS
jgi:heme/copper-type cytochrome/quinol oxidase subunit 2